ncbi:ImcF domain-containing protein [Enterobacter hormaechei]|nr:ImcF domain-containing protein [Enterobacter hormaechei]SAD06541.1 ImcF domain-containing protein [Enterobacter hormaechei]
MCHLYGRCWPRKLRILLITGSASDVEQLIPKLTQEFWQEDQGTLLLWGGDPAAPADAAWLTALRKLRRRPVDGVVWVTSAFDRLAGSDTELAAPLTPESMDALAHALKGRYDALGWKLPLYVWSLHPRAGEQLGRITQPVGCQLSAASKPEALARQLSDLIPALTAQGVQQICDKPQQSFLLALADQLTREPETLTGPLSVLLNPYRPLPLAGVVFSPATVGGVRSVAHHWGKDNRWDAIPASAQALPAGLRPRKHGVSWTQMVGVSVTALMALWVISMAVSFVANRSLVTMAQEQVQQSVAEKQPLSARLHALSELQKTLARLQYRAQHGVPWYAHGGLSQNDALLAALFPRYGESALPLLRDAAAEHLAKQLIEQT